MEDGGMAEDTFLPTVQILERMPREDGVPKVQPTPASIEYEMAPSSNLLQYVDHAGFPTEFNAEVEAIGELEQMLEVGKRHVHTLYTYRSVSMAIPLVSGSNDANKDLLHMRTFEVLRPEIEKLRDAMEFQDVAVKIFARHVATLATQGRKKVVPEGLYDALIAGVDVLQRLDHLKDSKACTTNDFSRYKRALTVVHSELPNGQELMMETQQLQMFLGNVKYPKQLIFNTLRDAVKRVPGHEDVVMRMLTQAVERVEAERFLTPDEKFGLLRTLPFLVVLLDGDGSGEGSFSAFRQKRVKIKDVQKICQRYPVVPEYADMAMQTSLIVQKAPHFDHDTMGTLFGSMTDSKTAQEYSILRHWEKIKSDYDEYTTSLALMLNEMGTAPFSKSRAAVRFARDVSMHVLQGLRLLQRWSCVLLEAAAWKFTHPCSTESVVKAGGNPRGQGVEYERAVRYNYSKEELSAVVEVMTMTKSLGSLLCGAEDRIAPFVRLHMHAATQQMAQGDLVPVLHRADKKKRNIMNVLLQLRAIVADWTDDVEKAGDYKKYKRVQGRVTAKFPPRLVGPSTTQLQLVRTLVRALYDENSELRQGSGLLNKEDLKREDLEALMAFYEDSWAFPYLTDLAGTLRQATDLGDLWYREFHLELTKCVQFPIEMSFPWIITEHIVHTKGAMAAEGAAAQDAVAAGNGVVALDNGGGSSTHTPLSRKKKKRGNAGQGHVLVEEVLWALDVYNDAAQRALYSLNSQFLFNEVQAEVNLVFGQLVFHLENEVYGYFKDWGASTVLDKAYKRKLEDRRGWGLYTPGRRRYETPLQQRHVQLMGRSVDLSRRFAFDMNSKVMEDVELAVKKFEGGGLSGILELEGTLAGIQRTHRQLADAGLALDPWPTLLGEVCEVVSPASCSGRLLTHVLTTLTMDLFVNSRYCSATQRFVASPVPSRPHNYPSVPTAIDKNLGGGRMCGKAFEQVFAMGRDFVGRPHLECVLRMLGSAELPLLFEELVKHLEAKLVDIKGWTDALVDGLEPVRLPKLERGMGHAYVYFEGKVAAFLKYEDIKSGVFQDFREFGNALAFLRDLSQVLESGDCLRYLHTVPVVGLAGSKSWDPQHTRIVATVTGVALAVRKSGDATKAAAAAALVERVRAGQELCRDFATTTSFFKLVMQRVEEACDRCGARQAWGGQSASNGVIETEYTTEFHRLFSVLNFLFCMPESGVTGVEALVSDHAQFGDAFALAGVTLIHILGQRHAFEMLDFSYQVVNIFTYEQSLQDPSRKVSDVDPAAAKRAQAFLYYAYHQRILHFDLFQMIERAHPHGVSTRQELIVFHPPRDDQELAERLVHAADVARSTPASPQPSRPLPSAPGGRGLGADHSGKAAELAAWQTSLNTYLGGDAPPPALPFDFEGAPDLTLLQPGSGTAAAAAGGGGSGPGSAFSAADTDPFAGLSNMLGGNASPGAGAMAASRMSPPTMGASPPLSAGASPNRFPPPGGAAPPSGMAGGAPGGRRPPPPGGAAAPPGSVAGPSAARAAAPAAAPRPGGADPLASSGSFGSMPAVGGANGGGGSNHDRRLSADVRKIMDMGFTADQAAVALATKDDNVQEAVQWLLDKDRPPPAPAPAAAPGERRQHRRNKSSDDKPPVAPMVAAPAPEPMKPKKLGIAPNPVFNTTATDVLIPARGAPQGFATQPYGSPPGPGGLPMGPGPGIVPARGPSGSWELDPIAAMDPDFVEKYDARAAAAASGLTPEQAAAVAARRSTVAGVPQQGSGWQGQPPNMAGAPMTAAQQQAMMDRRRSMGNLGATVLGAGGAGGPPLQQQQPPQQQQPQQQQQWRGPGGPSVPQSREPSPGPELSRGTAASADLSPNRRLSEPPPAAAPNSGSGGGDRRLSAPNPMTPPQSAAGVARTPVPSGRAPVGGGAGGGGMVRPPRPAGPAPVGGGPAPMAAAPAAAAAAPPQAKQPQHQHTGSGGAAGAMPLPGSMPGGPGAPGQLTPPQWGGSGGGIVTPPQQGTPLSGSPPGPPGGFMTGPLGGQPGFMTGPPGGQPAFMTGPPGGQGQPRGPSAMPAMPPRPGAPPQAMQQPQQQQPGMQPGQFGQQPQQPQMFGTQPQMQPGQRYPPQQQQQQQQFGQPQQPQQPQFGQPQQQQQQQHSPPQQQLQQQPRPFQQGPPQFVQSGGPGMMVPMQQPGQFGTAPGMMPPQGMQGQQPQQPRPGMAGMTPQQQYQQQMAMMQQQQQQQQRAMQMGGGGSGGGIPQGGPQQFAYQANVPPQLQQQQQPQQYYAPQQQFGTAPGGQQPRPMPPQQMPPQQMPPQQMAPQQQMQQGPPPQQQQQNARMQMMAMTMGVGQLPTQSGQPPPGQQFASGWAAQNAQGNTKQSPPNSQGRR